MMSTVGLELANFLNADLSWKRVSKGSRSAPRRPRKPVLEIADKMTRRADDTTVSESEKVGVAVLGRRFRENIEHVPIKKRRLPFRSPPPPAQLSSSHLDISETLMATDVNGGDGVGSGKISEVTSESLGHTEDFSGIEMLAAIACNNRMGDDTDHAGGNLVVEKSTQDRTETSISAIALAETTASLETVNISSHEDRMDGLSLQDNTVGNLPSDNDGKTTENFVSSRDDRLHWDLNVSMDAWEKPYDVYTQKNVVENISDSKQSEKLQIFEGCELQRETMDIKHDIEGAVQSTVGGVVSSDEHGDINIPVDLRGFSLGSDRSNGEEHELQAFSGLDRIHDKCVTTTICNALESSTYDVAITKAPTEVVSMDVNVDPIHGSDDIIANTGASEKNGNISLDSVIAKESNVALTHAPVSERTTCKIDGTSQKGDGMDTGTASGLHDDENTPEEMTSVDICLPLEPVSLEIKPVIRAAEVDAQYSESHCKDILVSGQSVVTKDAKGQADIAYVPHNAGVNSSLHVGSEYEDGELRELNVHSCKENEGAYGELEFVNNYSRNMDTSDVDDVDYLAYEKVQVGIGCREERSFVRNTEKNVEVQQGSSLGSDTIIERTGHFATADVVKEPLVRSETKSGADNSPGGHKISEKLTVGVTEGSTMRKIPDDCMDGLNEKNCPLEVVEPKISEKDSEFVQRSRSGNFDSCIRAEMDDATDHSIGRDKSALHVNIPTVGRLISPSTGFWDSKHHESPTYFDSYGSGRPRPKSAVESCGYVMTSDCTMSGAVWVTRVDNRVYRPSPRRRSPSDRADAYGIRRGMAPVREISSDRKFQRYPVGVSRGPREEYHRPVLDGSRDYSYRVPYHMAKGEHSISSPSKGRPVHYTQPYRKSRSRSRSRSPVAWLLPRERSEGSRHHRSQSPDHRFEAGMERVRLPLQKPIFSADNEAGFMSPPRRHFSPQRNSKWFGDQIESVDHFKGRRFSVRTFQQSQRFDPVHSPQGLDSDDYFEPMIRPGRFVDMDSAGRGCSDNDRRKHGGRYEIIHPVRRYGKNGVVRRFRYGAEDCLVSQNSHNYDDYDRGTDRRLRDVPRRVNEDKGHLRYNHGGLFDSSSSSFRTQDA